MTKNTGKRTVTYACVSSKDQADEGFSIPAQQRLLTEYATANGITVVQEFVDVETARRSGREHFGHLLSHLRKHPTHAVLVEKTDRLYRNITDYALLDELGVTIHFVKENVIISPDSRSADQFLHGIKVLMARNYSQNLGEETLKGMTEKGAGRYLPELRAHGVREHDHSRREANHHAEPRRARHHPALRALRDRRVQRETTRPTSTSRRPHPPRTAHLHERTPQYPHKAHLLR